MRPTNKIQSVSISARVVLVLATALLICSSFFLSRVRAVKPIPLQPENRSKAQLSRRSATVSNTIVISQIYRGGGNRRSTHKNLFDQHFKRRHPPGAATARRSHSTS